jgi:hypothetical protein
VFEIRGERGNGLEQELHAKRNSPCGVRPEEMFVEHEQRDDFAAVPLCEAGSRAQRRVIRDAQILAAVPDERAQCYLLTTRSLRSSWRST